MSAWEPITADGHKGIQRVWDSRGLPVTIAGIIPVPKPVSDRLNYAVYAASSYEENGKLYISKATTDSMAAAKVIAAALVKMVRRQCHAAQVRREEREDAQS